MSIEDLTVETRTLHDDARSASDAAHEVSNDVLAVARRINLSTTYDDASRWHPTLVASLEVLSEVLEDLMAIDSALDLVEADLGRVAGLEDPEAAEARIRISATRDLVEIAGDRCVEFGNLAELAAQRAVDFHEFEDLADVAGLALLEKDEAAVDRALVRLAELAAEISTLDTEATLDSLTYRRETLDTNDTEANQ